MTAKSIIIKTHSKELYKLLISKLISVKSIKFFSKKINNVYACVIKCNNYYSRVNFAVQESFYRNYIFLYSTLSLILSEILIEYFEQYIAKRFINSQYFYFPKNTLTQLTNLSSLVLSEYSTDYSVNELYLVRKEILLRELLNNFQKRNYLLLESFINFSSPNYHEILEYILSTSIELILSNQNLFH